MRGREFGARELESGGRANVGASTDPSGDSVLFKVEAVDVLEPRLGVIVILLFLL